MDFALEIDHDLNGSPGDYEALLGLSSLWPQDTDPMVLSVTQGGFGLSASCTRCSSESRVYCLHNNTFCDLVETSMVTARWVYWTAFKEVHEEYKPRTLNVERLWCTTLEGESTWRRRFKSRGY